MLLPRNGSTIPTRKAASCFKVMATWFRTAVLVGTVAFIVAPRGRNWMDPSITALIEDEKATMSLHRCCHFGETLTPENLLPSFTSYTMYCSTPVKWHTCECEKDTPHCKDYEDIIDRPWSTERRLKTDTSMIAHLFNHMRHILPP